tara:strand:+ start:43 stop:465 length:423 start_codon:yes stop_codon:yes gene_type:complete
MKKLKALYTTLVIVGILFAGILTLTAFTSNNPNEDIIGTWLSENDTNWKIEFKSNGKCYWYYTGDSTETYTYSISDFSNSLGSTTDFCGKTVSSGRTESYYLTLTDSDSDKLCYEIFGLTNDHLSLNYLGTSEIKIFNKL